MIPRKHVAVLVALMVLGWFSVSPTLGALEEPAEGDTAAVDRYKDDRLAELEKQLLRLRAEIEELRKAGGLDPARLEALERHVQELARQLGILALELERRQLGAAYRAAGASIHGLGPAASKVYEVEQGVSIGGYGEMLYQNQSGGDATLDFLRAVFYFGYKFNDRILFNSEIEFEHAIAGDGKGGEVAVEFAYLDFLVREEFNVRAGLLLLPVGFLNELHEPPIFFGATRPLVERIILPATWRENGAGAFGELASVSYRAYVVNGLNASGFTARNGIRSGRQGGSKAEANDLALAVRADWTIMPGLVVGASGYIGDSGQDHVVQGEPLGGQVLLYDLHAEWKWRGLQLRGLWAQVEVQDAAAINVQNGFTGADSIGEELVGWYGEIAYDLFARRDTEQQLIPYVRYESLNTQDEVPAGYAKNPEFNQHLLTVGIAYQPIPQVTLKVDVRDTSNQAGNAKDEFHVALGYLF